MCARACVPYATTAFTYAFGARDVFPSRPVPTPASHLVPGFVAGLDIVTAADATARQSLCGAQEGAPACDAVAGCEFWNERCGVDCQRLATSDACVVSEGCSWDGAHRHCTWQVPNCTAVSSPSHCGATKLCAYNASAVGQRLTRRRDDRRAHACITGLSPRVVTGSSPRVITGAIFYFLVINNYNKVNDADGRPSRRGECQAARRTCADIGDDATCKRSPDPRCVWNSESKACADLKECEAILLPADCPGHKGCAFSQSKGACVSLTVVAASQPVCVSSSECAVAETFCNMDFGSKGYCQNCLPLKALGGVEVCDDDKVVARPAAAMCKAACFGGE